MLKRAKSKPDPVKLSSADQAILQSHATLLDGLAAYLGAGFEFVLHRLDNLDASVIKIINGHLTGRQAGAPITDLALRMLAQINESQHSSAMNYFCRNRNGEPLKSTTLVIRGEQGTPIGLLCINFHLNTPLHEILGSFMQSPAGATEVLAENFGADVNETLSLALNTARKKVAETMALSSSGYNKAVINLLHEQGMFKLKGAVIQVARDLGVSRNTVYLHLRSAQDIESSL
ncbi:PAS domain-containing protein [Pseudomonas fuscovaginae UPB0736]|uniref:Predicted transcriptional regulator YheO, contains PAS and DNA-binding HTH domains n=1 Tax=Pseudomonas asplenii TaxID=53407 RepID=A0A1H6P3T6_9PSED|nr:PAS domain-containing protein [Pseudomonas fuscovaginae]UUQ65326.1 PAS domain-containing protein [Pseudomonas fuscovaginae UPB0736]SEI18578.1 Predicted transcriptional regulator YheO, contains PAS and DNA-binding HTH domains [Pseudomonas fuscovaginae]